jgi:hypothetical protein
MCSKTIDLDKIKKYHWYNGVYDYFYNSNVVAGIRNVMYFLPVIWDTGCWRGDETFVILKRKLEMDRKIIEDGYGIKEDIDERAKEITIVIDALDRLIKYNYITEDLRELHEKYNIKFEIDENNGSKPIEKEVSEKIKQLYEWEDEMVRRDLYIVFDTMKNNIGKWWD